MTQLPGPDVTDPSPREFVPDDLPAEPSATFDPQRSAWANADRLTEQTTSGLVG